ncbi:MAG: STAS domain-containing protein [Lachnospiraceae bacterium]|uniref:STAS domain-containing protein n=1 Tax=Sarcina sp. DSM 11001 TaxID=1798184 RepID=UPI00088AD0F1|nr:STAS domain-containing protein [Sarcina sp. DSM 11001]MDO5485346.1 STAS domain-containing protein [Sarcina sp.]MEE1039873.1 STAS domain-containing protein [Lachnospiraceae bacterium]SDK91704.1 anti-sigma B factor antagonist [Sarcina sp. DSM 11001]
MLNIEKKTDGSSLNIALEGRLDTMTSPQLEETLKDSLDGVTSLIMDFEKLEYISSAGLRVLLSAQKIMNKQGEMKLIHVNEVINEIFEVTGFSDILTIE